LVDLTLLLFSNSAFQLSKAITLMLGAWDQFFDIYKTLNISPLAKFAHGISARAN
jgi:hypothetical protein